MTPLSALLLSGCGSVSYLLQAGKGQLELANRARPIDEVIKDERTPVRIKDLLSHIAQVKKFGETSGLKPTQNYTDFVQLNRDAVVWVVSASKPLSFSPREWSFPIVGSFTYLGWFDLNGAKKLAKDLREEGLDVDLRGARAYSTLGWFKDSVLSTMIPSGDEALGELVNVVIHESVHATYYIKGQSWFNESLANFVADEMTPIYLDSLGEKFVAAKKAYENSEIESLKIGAEFHQAYDQLEKIYQSSQPDESKLAQKHEVINALTTKLKWRREINNASLIQFKTYRTGLDEFKALYLQCGKSWDLFWKKIKTIDAKRFSKPQQEDFAKLLQ